MLKGKGQIRPFCQKARHISGHLFTLAQCLCVSPCSESHPLLCLSVYTAVYCGSARGKQENCCSNKAKAIDHIVYSMTVCLFEKLPVWYIYVWEPKTKMLITLNRKSFLDTFIHYIIHYLLHQIWTFIEQLYHSKFIKGSWIRTFTV